MKDKNKKISFILKLLLSITVIFLFSFTYADQKVDPNQFKREAISQEVPFETKTPIGKAHQEAVQIYQKTEDYRKSLEILQKAKIDELIEKSPEQVPLTKKQYTAIMNDYAFFLYRDIQLDKALMILQRVIQLTPERTVAYLNRGDIYRETYQWTKDNKHREFYLEDYRTYNKQMTRMKRSYLVPERVEKDLYTLVINRPPKEEDKRIELGKQLINAASENKTEELIKLLKEGVDPNFDRYDPEKSDWYYVGEEHKIAIHYAAENSNIEMVKYLLNNGAELAPTRQGKTPIFFAAESADLEMVKYLIQRGEAFDQMMRPHRGYETVICFAACGEKSGYDVFEYLLSLYRGDYRRLMGGEGDTTFEDSITCGSKLKNYEKGYKVVTTLYNIVDKIKTRKEYKQYEYQIEKYDKAFQEAYINAVSVNNKKLATFLAEKGIKVDKNQYIISLIKAKHFKKAKEEINNAKEIDGEVFIELSEARYEGAALEELLVAAMKKYDVNRILPTKYKWEEKEDYNDYVSRFIHQIKVSLDKERVIKILKLMLDNGLKPAHFNSQFHYIVSLDDIEFSKHVLQMGVNVNRKTYQYLFANAKSMEMVKFLESQGFSLTKEEYQKIVESKNKYPELMKGIDPKVIEYYQSKIK